MAGNTFGILFKVTTFGESHGNALGVVVDGCPAGLEVSREDIQGELNRRMPGQSHITTPRKEKDQVEILSGLFEGRTTGMPIAMIVFNQDVDSSAYEKYRNVPRPGHADLTYFLKYGIRDHRGGGRSSGRETLARVAAGAIAKKLLKTIHVEILGHTIQIFDIHSNPVSLDDIRENPEKNNVRCADLGAAKKMEESILKLKSQGDSCGGRIELIALNLPAGLGEPVFHKLDGEIARAIMSVGAVKGVEIGAGFQVSGSRGSENNDPFYFEGEKIKTTNNNSGGILGGISNGMPIIVRAAIKPTPSISIEQKTVDLAEKKDTTIIMGGRHDPCIVPRVLPVCESMLALVIADHALRAGSINPNKLA